MRIHYRVQHTAGRTEPLARLLERLPPAVEVITDHERSRNPLRTYLRCLADPPEDATHLAILQDDALPCQDFERKLLLAIEEKPDELLSLFVGGLSNRTRRDFHRAMIAKQRWAQIYFRDIHHVVALVWPVSYAASFLEWFKTAKLPGAVIPRSDDAALTYWIKKGYSNKYTRKIVWATVPCLVEHPDDFPTLLHGQERLGQAGRRAIYFEQ